MRRLYGGLALIGVLCSVACSDDDDVPLDGGGGDVERPECATDDECDDGVFCNGAERCAMGRCVTGAAPCMPTQRCDEPTGTCETECAVAPDADGDGHIAIECGGDDCDDTDPNRFPGNLEICDAEHRDEDCDPRTFGERDLDGDGFVSNVCCNVQPGGSLRCGDDCDDTRRTVNPGRVEVCDGLDNDCNGVVDEGVLIAGFVDLDQDLHGDPDSPYASCPGDPRLSLVGDDCDDMNPAVHRAQPEICDGIDNNCNGEIDEGCGAVVWYRDLDGDGFGHPASGTVSADRQPGGHSILGSDCDDDDPLVYPGAPERCNARDDDCNGLADFRIGVNDFEDDDRDGYPDAACAGADPRADCDDEDPRTYPGAPELQDGFDNDCNGRIDEACEERTWYLDVDGDGWGDGSAPTRRACVAPEGHAVRAGDCADMDPERNPGAREVCNGFDDDCDGEIDENAARYCELANAVPACTMGMCEVRFCAWGFEDCDDGRTPGCEANLRDNGTGVHCGGCGNFCPAAPRGAPICVAAECAFECAPGFADCDGDPSNGCETDMMSDPASCGACGRTCSARPNAAGRCDAGTCGLECAAGFADCDRDLSNGCEVQTSRDRENCGACGVACPAAGDICLPGGSCIRPAFPSNESNGAFAPTEDVVLDSGVYHFTTITIPAGVTVTTNGPGVLELYASGDVRVDGTIDVSGGRGGNGPNASGDDSLTQYAGGGGATGDVLAPGADAVHTEICAGGGGGGLGVPGGDAASSACGTAGRFGGGGGGSSRRPGGGGGGYAAGAGGRGRLGNGASGGGVLGEGGVGGASGGGGGGAALGVYAGRDGTGRIPGSAEGDCGGGGGGSIGSEAASDLAVATTFRPGSGGGGGGGCNSCTPCRASGAGGGGGGGGALRVASATRIVVGPTGALRANGGAGGSRTWDNNGGGGGGGSGGVIYLAAPSVSSLGTVEAIGGDAGATGSGGPRGGRGGLGRIRVSVLADECSLLGGWNPPLHEACAVTSGAGVAGRTYVGAYPN